MALLAETDALHATLSGPATKHLMQRALTVFDDTRYARLAPIRTRRLMTHSSTSFRLNPNVAKNPLVRRTHAAFRAAR